MFNEDYGDLITPLRATSVDIAQRWVQPVGLLFVDTIHEGWAVRKDWAAWHRHMATESVAAFHDYGESYPGVKEAIETRGDGLPIRRAPSESDNS